MLFSEEVVNISEKVGRSSKKYLGATGEGLDGCKDSESSY